MYGYKIANFPKTLDHIPNNFCVTPHKNKCLYKLKQLSRFDQLYKLTTLGTICAGTCLVILYYEGVGSNVGEEASKIFEGPKMA